MQTTSPALCSHCHLPVTARGRSKSVGLEFCCYGCSLAFEITGQAGEEGQSAAWLIRLGLGSFLGMNVMLFSWLLYSDAFHDIGPDIEPVIRWILLVISTPVMVALGSPFLANALRQLRAGSMATDALIALGAFAAYGYSAWATASGRSDVYFDTATMILVLVTLGRYLEASSRAKSTAEVEQTFRHAATDALVFRNGREISVATEEVVVGDELILHTGTIPVADGTIIEGEVSVAEAILTGESAPVHRVVGDRLYAGTAVHEGWARVLVEQIGKTTTLAEISNLMTEARMTQGPIGRTADRAAQLFAPIMVSIAVGTAAYWWWYDGGMTALINGLAVLVVACPCALGLAAPMATTVALGRAAALGAIFRSAAAIESLGGVDTIFWDKTGTVTTGHLSVVDFFSFEGNSGALLNLAASAESRSEHPIGVAIISFAKGKNSNKRGEKIEKKLLTPTDYSVHVGMGVKAVFQTDGCEKTVLVGNSKLMDRYGIPLEHDGRDGATPVYVACNGALKGVIWLEDSPRSGAKEVMATIAALGIQNVILSGDTQSVARSVGNALGIEVSEGSLLPQEKAARVTEMRKVGHRVVMVGDGVNDAPALASADVGISLGSGTDLAKDAADVTVLGDKIELIPSLVSLSNATRRIIVQNLGWAFFYNGVAVLLAAMGWLSPVTAALAMVASSTVVVGNSLRLRKVSL